MTNNTEEFKNLDAVLEALPVESPSRDLVSAAIDEVYGGERLQWPRMVLAVAAALVLACLTGLFVNSPSEPPVTDASPKARITQARARARRLDSIVGTVKKNQASQGYATERRLDGRIARARNGLRTLKEDLREEEKSAAPSGSTRKDNNREEGELA